MIQSCLKIHVNYYCLRCCHLSYIDCWDAHVTLLSLGASMPTSSFLSFWTVLIWQGWLPDWGSNLSLHLAIYSLFLSLSVLALYSTLVESRPRERISQQKPPWPRENRETLVPPTAQIPQDLCTLAQMSLTFGRHRTSFRTNEISRSFPQKENFI